MLLADKRLTGTDRGTPAPQGEAKALAKKASTLKGAAQSTPKPAQAGPAKAEGAGEPLVRERVVVVQMSVVGATDEARDQLFALRDLMHRVLNAALSEWHRSEKVASKKNPDKLTLDRAPVTEAVQAILERERAYWNERLPKDQATVQRIRVSLGRATTKGRAVEIERIQGELDAALRACARTRTRCDLRMPSSIYDAAVRWTQSRHGEYLKAAFRGERTLDTYRAGQPIRWRDGAWDLKTGERRGSYDLALPVHSDGKKVERVTLRVIPDGPSMHAHVKRLIDSGAIERGEVKLCDARLVYSEKKKQWFAKLTARVTYTPVIAGAGVAALRRGRDNAFVISFENDRSEFITGSDVLEFKRRIRARRQAVGNHLRSLELGTGARGHGRKRRFKALQKVDDAEDRFVDWRCKTWAAAIVKLLKARGVGRLLVSAMSVREMLDAVDGRPYAPLLAQWPFAKALGAIQQACVLAGIEVAEFDPKTNSRRCPVPSCGHEHAATPGDLQFAPRGAVFTCDVCGYKRPVDHVIGMNALRDAVGDGPIKADLVRGEERDAALQALAGG